MDGKSKKKKKGARKQICFQICTPGACSGVGTVEHGSGGPLVLAACVHCGDSADGAAAPRWKNTGQPWNSGSTACPAAPHGRGAPGRAGVWCRGVSRELGRRGMGGSRDVFKCISLYICSLNAYGTGGQSIWALHNN